MNTTPIPRTIDGRGDFQQAVRDALAQAAAAGSREILCCDLDYADWPLGERVVIDSLTAWAQSHRKLTLIAQHFDTVLRQHARFVAWRRHWSHVVQCRTLAEQDALDPPVLLLAPGVVSLRLADPLRHRGVLSAHAADEIRWGKLIDAILQRSTPGFAATTLGL